MQQKPETLINLEQVGTYLTMLKKIKMNLRQVEKWKVEARCEFVVLTVIHERYNCHTFGDNMINI